MRRNFLISPMERPACWVIGNPKLRANLPFLSINLRRRVAGAARREAHGEKTVIRCAEPFAFYPRDIVEVGGLLSALSCKLRL